MAPIVITALQVLFLLLLYAFVARTVRWVIRDVATAQTATGSVTRAQRRSVRSRSTNPRKRALPRELVVHPDHGAPRVMALDEGREITFGRHDTATVVLNDPYTSDVHARIRHNGQDWIVSDEGSTNGTYLNSVRLTTPTAIRAGDQITIGRTSVEVRR